MGCDYMISATAMPRLQSRPVKVSVLWPACWVMPNSKPPWAMPISPKRLSPLRLDVCPVGSPRHSAHPRWIDPGRPERLGSAGPHSPHHRSRFCRRSTRTSRRKSGHQQVGDQHREHEVEGEGAPGFDQLVGAARKGSPIEAAETAVRFPSVPGSPPRCGSSRSAAGRSSGGVMAIVIVLCRSRRAISVGPVRTSTRATDPTVTSSPFGVATGNCSRRWVCWPAPGSAMTRRSISCPSWMYSLALAPSTRTLTVVPSSRLESPSSAARRRSVRICTSGLPRSRLGIGRAWASGSTEGTCPMTVAAQADQRLELGTREVHVNRAAAARALAGRD